MILPEKVHTNIQKIRKYSFLNLVSLFKSITCCVSFTLLAVVISYESVYLELRPLSLLVICGVFSLFQLRPRFCIPSPRFSLKVEPNLIVIFVSAWHLIVEFSSEKVALKYSYSEYFIHERGIFPNRSR